MDKSAQKWFRENQGRFTGQILWDEPMAKHTYYRIGGPAAVFAVPKSLGDLEWLAQGILQTGLPFFVIGMGSNLLVSDSGFPGLIIRTSRINLEIQYDPADGILRTGASVAISSLLRRASQEGWEGLEFLTGVPGSVGGAVFMNAGTHLGETASRIRRVEVFLLDRSGGRDLNQGIILFEGKDLQFQYRKNLFLPPNSIVWAAEWIVHLASPSQVKSQIDQILARRKASQPIDFPSCGSVFKNPKSFGVSAWQVIDQLGLRGYQTGGARFSDKHSNFILNLGGATAEDVRSLIQLAKDRAQRELGIDLEEEVIWVGE